MVAYSCQKQFVPDIQAGLKTHTIRADRKRHARVGEPIQLYCGMRTSHCFKIIPDPVCTYVVPVQITVANDRLIMIWIGPDQAYDVLPSDFDKFARLDGFADAQAMAKFWSAKDKEIIEGTTAKQFDEWMICWGAHPIEALKQ